MSRRLSTNRAAATYPIVVAGFLYGVGRNGAYAAAAAGSIPTVRVCGRLLAIADPINRALGLTGLDDPKVREAYKLAKLQPPPLPDEVQDKSPDKTLVKAGAADLVMTQKPKLRAPHVAAHKLKSKSKPKLKSVSKRYAEADLSG